MKWKDALMRKLCPTCKHETIETQSVINVLERSADALDRISADIFRMRETAREGDNPFLGKHPIHVQRKERPR